MSADGLKKLMDKCTLQTILLSFFITATSAAERENSKQQIQQFIDKIVTFNQILRQIVFTNPSPIQQSLKGAYQIKIDQFLWMDMHSRVLLQNGISDETHQAL